MATIKDVAKLAGVSLGTVSNVLNGKTQNLALIKRVEEAMTALNYYPDANARSLKNTKTNTIGLILPDADKLQYSKFLMLMEQSLRERGYSLLVKFSRNNQLLEKKAIEAFLEQRSDGIIIWSTLPQKQNPRLKASKTPVLLVSSNELNDCGCDRVVLQYSSAFRRLLSEFKSLGYENVGLVMEREFLQDGSFAEAFKESYPDPAMIRIVDGSVERGFEAMFELSSSCEKLDAVIAGNYETGKGIYNAAKIIPRSDVKLFALKEANWFQDTDVFEGIIDISLKDVVSQSVSRIIEAIESPQLHEQLTRYVPASLKKVHSTKKPLPENRGEMRFAMYNCSSARSLKILAGIYEKQSGMKIHFDMYPYNQLEELLYKEAEAESKQYDGFMMDITWFDSLVETGMVKNLDSLGHENKAFFDGFVAGSLNEYSLYKGSLYSIPFMPGAQLMFYQRDLFEDKSLQIKYQRKYSEKLRPPESWSEFNAVAEFFTKEFNPDSPVKYGLSMSSGASAYTSIDFLNRLWAYGGRVFDEFGQLSLASNSAVNALNNLKQSYKYCSGRSFKSWDECADDFAKGSSAMVILFTSDVGDINNYTKSKVAGNIGYSLIPGGSSVKGGWSFGINPLGENQKAAEDFLLWACSDRNCLPVSILGGSTLRKEYYERSDLETQEPWKDLVLLSAEKSRERSIPKSDGLKRIKSRIYSEIIPSQVSAFIEDRISAEKALENMENEIKELL